MNDFRVSAPYEYKGFTSPGPPISRKLSLGPLKETSWSAILQESKIAEPRHEESSGEVALASLNTRGRPASVDGGFFTSGDGLEHQPEDAHAKPRRLQKHTTTSHS